MIERRLPLFLKFIATVFALGYAITSSAQATIPHRVLNMENGLPSNEVYCITQDANGTMWMGTDMGLVKYDGNEMKVLIPETKSSISVLRFFVDYQNRMWLSTFRNGLFYLEGDSLIEPSFNPALQELMQDYGLRYVRSFYRDSTDALTFIFDGAVSLFASSELNSKSVAINAIPTRSVNNFYILEEERGEPIAYGFTGVVERVKGTDHNKLNRNRKIRFFNFQSKLISHCGFINDGAIIWVVNKVFSIQHGKTDSVVLNHAINHVYMNKNNYFISTEKGLYHYTDSISENSLRGIYFQADIISRVIRDKEGVFWITTVGNGCFIVPSFNSNSFNQSIGSNYSKYYGSYFLKNDTLNILDKNELLFAEINDGIKVYKRIKAPFQPYRRGIIKWLDNERVVLAYSPLQPKSQRILALDSTFIEVCVIRQKDLAIEGSIFINAVETSAHGDTVYILTTRGIEIIIANQLYFQSDKYFDKDVQCLLKQSASSLLIGTTKGLYLLDIKQAASKRLFPDQLNGVITCLEKNEDGLVFIGTRGSGLGVYDGQELQMISTGLHNDENTINQIVCKGRNVWLRTQKEIMLLRQKADSDSFVQLHLPSAFIGADYVNTLLFSNNKPVLLHDDRLVYFDTAVLNYPFSNSFSVSSLSVNDEQYAPDDFANLDLAYDDNNLGVGLKLHTLHQAKENKIAYRLLGQDDKWVITDEKKIRFLGLQSGDYKLQVRAENAIGAWSEPRDVIQFTIQKHFAQTALFKLGVVLGLLVIFGAAFFIGKSATNREKLLLQANITALKRQINPHFILNALNGIRYYQSEKDFKKADEYILKLAELLRNIVYSTDNKRVRLSDEMKRIESYVSLEKMRFEGGFSFAINNLNEVDYSKVFIPPMLLQPIIENAIKHGLSRVDEPALELTIDQKNNTLIITIKDNGPGIAGDEIAQINRSQSIGISNTRNRIDLIRKLEKKQISMEIVSNGGLEVMIKVEQ
jgi:two-component sensor histidine kinase